MDTLPNAAVVVHTLKLMYHSGDEHDEFFIALDINDVRELRELLNRAEKKDQVLQARFILKIGN